MNFSENDSTEIYVVGSHLEQLNETYPMSNIPNIFMEREKELTYLFKITIFRLLNKENYFLIYQPKHIMLWVLEHTKQMLQLMVK